MNKLELLLKLKDKAKKIEEEKYTEVRKNFAMPIYILYGLTEVIEEIDKEINEIEIKSLKEAGYF